jgi:hypothetical protein
MSIKEILGQYFSINDHFYGRWPQKAMKSGAIGKFGPSLQCKVCGDESPPILYYYASFATAIREDTSPGLET